MEDNLLDIIKQITADYYRAIENNADDFTLNTYVSVLYSFTQYYLKKRKEMKIKKVKGRNLNENR